MRTLPSIIWFFFEDSALPRICDGRASSPAFSSVIPAEAWPASASPIYVPWPFGKRVVDKPERFLARPS